LRRLVGQPAAAGDGDRRGNGIEREQPTGALLPVIAAASVSFATMLCAPSPDSVTLVDHAPPLPAVAVPIAVVTPLMVS